MELKEEVEYYEKEMAKATPKQPDTILLDDHEVTARAEGKSLRSGKLLPDILQNLGGVADPLPEDDENVFDNISVSDSEEDDGFNHWTSNEGRYVLSVIYSVLYLGSQAVLEGICGKRQSFLVPNNVVCVYVNLYISSLFYILLIVQRFLNTYIECAWTLFTLGPFPFM